MMNGKTFRDYTNDQARWITFVEGKYYPDSLMAAIPIYEPVLAKFGDALGRVANSAELLQFICKFPQAQRIQLLRVFRKYVSPDTSVEMLKKQTKIPEIIREFGSKFRDLATVRTMFN